MIVESMTWEEVSKEIEKEVIELSTKAENISMERYRRKIIKGYTGDLPDFTIKSSRGNIYHFIPKNEGKKSIKLGFSHLIYLRRELGGKTYYINLLKKAYISGGKLDIIPTFIIFTSHTFKRYQERKRGGSKISFTQFLRENNQITLKISSDKSMFAVSESGIFFGSIIDNVMMYKTFITKEMLFEDQKEVNEKASKYREYIMEISGKKK